MEVLCVALWKSDLAPQGHVSLNVCMHCVSVSVLIAIGSITIVVIIIILVNVKV